ncbi:TetR/AcrR family transcriptional regulator [Acidaminococcus massiliensis]|uniref:TetR/AcrR family transcriptional regulator n=1 Tax=Acidaminococcus massiliensis TaxID=1852375 RepID=UPI0026DC8E0E|nr:TetR/AcrR family transcriptional regulator [Acidaminococcus massiliensis]
MFHKGLNKEIIINTAIELIEQDGFPAFSMRKLAEKLNVKTASLYAHIESMEALFTEIGLAALREQRNCLLNAVGEQHGDVAVTALADGYRHFAAEHAELYKIIMQMPSGDDAILKEAAAMTAEPFMRVLADYELSEEQRMHWQRVLRGLMHGFVSEAQAGYFSHYPLSVEESYEIAVRCMIEGLHREEGESNGR